MSLGRQAKVLSKGQLDAALGLLAKSRYPARNQVILLLSSKAGLRAKEIARLRWTMVIDAEGELSKAICLDDHASKGRSGRTIPIHAQLRAALMELHREVKPRPDDFVVTTERSKRTSPQVIVNLFARWYGRNKRDSPQDDEEAQAFITMIQKGYGDDRSAFARLFFFLAACRIVRATQITHRAHARRAHRWANRRKP